MFKQTTLIAASAVVIGLVAAPALAQQGKGTSGYLTDTRNAMDVNDVASAVVYMDSLSLDSNVQFMTIMATKMPFIGRG